MHPRHRSLFVFILAALACVSVYASDDANRWKREAQAVTVQRDDWGIAHVHGKTNADAVFGMAYTQAEDDFNRVETNYLTALGRTAEADGESAIWQDLRQRLFIDPVQLQAMYARSPRWLKSLMDAWADGLNDYPSWRNLPLSMYSTLVDADIGLRCAGKPVLSFARSAASRAVRAVG